MRISATNAMYTVGPLRWTIRHQNIFTNTCGKLIRIRLLSLCRRRADPNAIFFLLSLTTFPSTSPAI